MSNVVQLFSAAPLSPETSYSRRHLVVRTRPFVGPSIYVYRRASASGVLVGAACGHFGYGMYGSVVFRLDESADPTSLLATTVPGERASSLRYTHSCRGGERVQALPLRQPLGGREAEVIHDSLNAIEELVTWPETSRGRSSEPELRRDAAWRDDLFEIEKNILASEQIDPYILEQATPVLLTEGRRLFQVITAACA